MRPGINVMMPPNFHDKLVEYLENIRKKKNEYDKRSYIESKLMIEILGIKPEFIDFEKDHVDLYFAGVLLETKSEITNGHILKGLSEIQEYLKRRPNTAEAVITDGITFYIYEDLNIFGTKATPEQLYKNLKCEKFIINSSTNNSKYKNVDANIFQKLYLIFYPRLRFKEIEEDTIAPRLIKLVDSLSGKINKVNDTKFKAWRNFLSVAIGNSSNETNEDLYRRYVVLYYVTTLMVAKVMQIGGNISDLISPAAYVSKGILNFIEGDSLFSILDEKSDVIREIDDELSLYEFTSTKSVSTEVFRLLYEHLISPSERHDLGEFYTPEWLAKILVDDAIKTGDETVLDPSCGSGTFVRLALRRIKKLNGNGKVVGFDINPIAVHIARANYLTEKPDESILPIFLADSLMPGLPLKDVAQKSLQPIGEVNVDFDSIIGEGGKHKFYYRTDYDLKQITGYIQNMMDIIESGNFNIPNELPENADIIKTILALRAQNKNHVWGFILKNIYTPYYMREKADIVIGNPPWLTYHDVASPKRQQFLDNIYTDYNMMAGGRNKTHQDMAGFFICRSFEYLKNKEGRVYFVVTRSIMNADQYHGLRTGSWKNLHISNDNRNNKIALEKIWDISKDINPFNKPSCMAEFHTGIMQNIIPGYKIVRKNSISNKKLIRNGEEVNTVQQNFYVNVSRNYSGIGYERHDFGHEVSPYRDKFFNGATIFPRPYFFIKEIQREKYGTIVSTQEKYTSESNKRRKKGDFKAHFDEKRVPNELIFSVILGENIDNFRVDTSNKAVLPIYQDGYNVTSVLNQQTSSVSGRVYRFTLNKGAIDKISGNIFEKNAMKQLYESYVKEFNEFEIDWETHRREKMNKGGKQSAQMSLWDNLNYMGKLTSQNPFMDNLAVVYNKSGTSIRCAVVKSRRIVFENKTFYYYTDSESEAYYLEGVLNSDITIDILRKTGIMSERDIEKKIFEVNIPQFDYKNPIHTEISKLSKQISVSVYNGGKLDDQDNQERLSKIEKYVSKLF